MYAYAADGACRVLSRGGDVAALRAHLNPRGTREALLLLALDDRSEFIDAALSADADAAADAAAIAAALAESGVRRRAAKLPAEPHRVYTNSWAES